ncbi:hypothetical protein QQS21_006519 [Conoideocrella luteorostrata]|uniref:FAD-binding domain-containing protein n=1 Tax=Conoideocrella luteorostrata TaxID=1105319 RepID=A0AAJ0CMT0_9HYPO|nr:hypothetical protein QQS21_006519 [Conoideocrella luteorostrata]
MSNKPFHVLIVGAGPAGLATALALTKNTPATPSATSSPLRITVVELRDGVQTLGGAVNLTPLALRYLDWLGVGEKLRPQASTVSAIEIVGHRTGQLLGRMWPGVDAVRVQRRVLVEAMRDAIYEVAQTDDQRIEILYGTKIREIKEFGKVNEQDGGMQVAFINNTTGEDGCTLEADIVVGCDGIHSQIRNAVIEPTRQKTYSGRCNSYGYADLRKSNISPERLQEWIRADGGPLVTDTSLIFKGSESLLITYYEPSHQQLYLAFVNSMEEKTDMREGWAAHGADKAGIKKQIKETFEGGKLPCLSEIIDLCHEWFFFPVYMLPLEGTWYKGRAIVIGDAAHAMPPQGESTGIAIEDGVLLARVLSRRTTKTIDSIFADFETLRRPDIREFYKETMSRWNAKAPGGWLGNIAMDWFTWGFLKLMGLRKDYFGRDVRNRELPE